MGRLGSHAVCWVFTRPAAIGSPAPAQRPCPCSPDATISTCKNLQILQSNSERGLGASSPPVRSLRLLVHRGLEFTCSPRTVGQRGGSQHQTSHGDICEAAAE